MSMLKKYQAYIFAISMFAVAALTSPIKAFAAITGNQLTNLVPLITTKQTGTNVLTRTAVVIINVILLLAGILAVVYLIYSGILYITAGGDTGKAEKGRTGIVNAVIGLVIVSAAYLLVRFVGGLVSGAGTTGGTTTPI